MSLKRVAITGGGTGGHLSIAKALAVQCQKRGFKCVYIGSQSGQDRVWFENSEIFEAKYFLKSSGVVNKRGFGLLKSLWMQFCAVLKSMQILRRHKIDFVISVGGFSAGGGSIAALLCQIPLFIHEQNSVFGTLNRILAPFARAVFGSFEMGGKNFICTAYPINEIYRKLARVRGRVECILFLGGSQGAMAINDFALNLAPELLKRGIKIIHQCGKADFERVKSAYSAINADKQVTLFDFSDNLAEFITKADFCVSRAGASSLWEMVANYLPCYFVPYPFAAKNHQFLNADFLAKRGLCEVVRQKDLDKDAFLKYLDSAKMRHFENIADSATIANISQNLAKLPYKNGSEEIIDLILERA
ncbi:undecaprenyldiphospho-muramoylpentapeptide beta-N-acetylglucosaminyltransferase [Helicobacter sp. 23-1045]